jgi:hypothetical protein
VTHTTEGRDDDPFSYDIWTDDSQADEDQADEVQAHEIVLHVRAPDVGGWLWA